MGKYNLKEIQMDLDYTIDNNRFNARVSYIIKIKQKCYYLRYKIETFICYLVEE